MKQNNFPRLPSNPCKAEEIQFLEELAGIVPQGTYLSSLFSPSLMAAFKSRVRDDVSCDIVAEMNIYIRDKNELATGLMTERISAQHEIDRLLVENKALRLKVEKMRLLSIKAERAATELSHLIGDIQNEAENE